MADVDVEREGARDVFLRRQLHRTTAEYHLSIEYQVLQTTMSQHCKAWFPLPELTARVDG